MVTERRLTALFTPTLALLPANTTVAAVTVSLPTKRLDMAAKSAAVIL